MCQALPLSLGEVQARQPVFLASLGELHRQADSPFSMNPPPLSFALELLWAPGPQAWESESLGASPAR